MLSAGAQFPLILRLVARGHCHAMAVTFTTDNCGSKLRAPDKPHEQLADRVPLADPNGPAHAARRPTACSALKLWWSAEMDRLTYSEWQLEAALPRMPVVRRWDKNRGHHWQRDDASSAAAARAAPDFKLADSEAEATARALKLPLAA